MGISPSQMWNGAKPPPVKDATKSRMILAGAISKMEWNHRINDFIPSGMCSAKAEPFQLPNHPSFFPFLVFFEVIEGVFSCEEKFLPRICLLPEEETPMKIWTRQLILGFFYSLSPPLPLIHHSQAQENWVEFLLFPALCLPRNIWKCFRL